MADISRNTTPAWQDPHLKDRGDYTEQDIQNIQEKGGILPDFTLDEASMAILDTLDEGPHAGVDSDTDGH